MGPASLPAPQSSGQNKWGRHRCWSPNLADKNKWGRHRCRPHDRLLHIERLDECLFRGRSGQGGRGDAFWNTSRTIAPKVNCIVMLVASGLTDLDPPGPEGLARLPQSFCRSRYGGSVEPTLIARHFCRRPVPSGGRVQLRGAFTFHLAVPRSVSLLPFGPAVPPCRSRASLRFLLAVRNRPSGCAPLAASTVRQVCSEERPRRVFRCCYGHRCRIVWVKLSRSFSRVSPLQSPGQSPSRHPKAAPSK